MSPSSSIGYSALELCSLSWLSSASMNRVARIWRGSGWNKQFFSSLQRYFTSLLSHIYFYTPSTLQVLSKAPGLTGLLVSAVVAASLSTISSVTHSLAASVWEDLIYQSRWAETSSQSERVLTIRVISVISGIITLLLAYCYSHLEQALHLATLAPLVLSGPLLAVFLMGFFVPFANKIVSGDNLVNFYLPIDFF